MEWFVSRLSDTLLFVDAFFFFFFLNTYLINYLQCSWCELYVLLWFLFFLKLYDQLKKWISLNSAQLRL